MGNSSVQQGSLSCGASPCKTDLPWIQGFHAASVIDLNGTISSKKSIEQIWRDTQQAQSCSPKMRQGAAQFSPSILAFWKAHFGPFSEACQLWTWISEHYEMVHLHFFFSSCRRWRKKNSQSQNSAGMHLSVTHCLLSFIIYFKSNSRTTSRTCTVQSISSNSTWVYPIYLPINLHDSSWFCMSQWRLVGKPLTWPSHWASSSLFSSSCRTWITSSKNDSLTTQAVFEGFTSDSVFGYLRISMDILGSLPAVLDAPPPS